MSTFTQFLASLETPDGQIPGALSFFLAYENLSAALWAMETLTGLRGGISNRSEPRLSSWSFPTLENPKFRARATAVAVEADLIVIAISSGFGLLPAALEGWLRRCLAGQRSGNAAVVALVGRADFPDREDSLRLKTVQGMAREVGRLFFAPWVTEEAL
jgi:hypothetical protein